QSLQRRGHRLQLQLHEAGLHHRPADPAGLRGEVGMVSEKTIAAIAAALLLSAGSACKPEFAERASQVTSLRVLAVGSDPAEADPLQTNKMVQYSALVVDPKGPRDDAQVQWTFCTDPKPVNELNDVSNTCFDPDPDASQFILLMGTGPKASAP